MRSDTAERRARVRLAGLGAVLAIALAACGSQVPHSTIVAANGPLVGTEVGAAGGAVGTGSAGDGGFGAATGTSGASAGSAASSGSDGSGSGSGDGSGSASGDGSGSGAAPGSQSSGGVVGSSTAATPGAAGGAGGAAPAPTGSTIVLGNIGSYSGVLGAVFPGGPAGILAWAQEVNAQGGIDGHPVKVVSGDDGGDPSVALTLAKQMVQGDGAIALVGSMVPLSLSGIEPYLDQEHIPLIGGDVTLPNWIQDPDIFPQGTDVTSISVGAVRLITAGGHNKLAILYCGESPSCKGLADGAEASPPAGVQIVYTAEISIVQTDFTTECLQAKNDGATAIFVAADANSVIRVGMSCSQQDYHPRYGTASIAVGPQLASDPEMNGLIAPVNNAPWFLSNTPATQEFANAMATYEPGAPLAATAMSMFASGELVQAAGAHLGPHPTAAGLIAGLDSLRGVTLGGLAPPLSFSPGQGSGAIPCYFVVEVSNGQWTAPDGATPQCP